MKSYRGEDGKLYWNKKMPVYIQLSTTPDGKGETLQSQVHPEYTKPYYFDTEGDNYIRTRYAVDKETGKPVQPEVEVLWDVYADGLAPSSSMHYGTSNLFTSNNIIYCGKDFGVTITAKDAVSGVDKIYYSVDQNTYQAYGQSIALTEEKNYNIQYYAVDNVGNVEEVNAQQVQLDLSAPVTSIDIGGIKVDNIVSRKATATLEADDKASGVSKIYYSIDGTTEKIYSGRLYLAWLPEGEHEITYYSVDNVNNKEAIKSYKFYMDKTAPEVTASIEGDTYTVGTKTYFSSRTKLKLEASDNKAGVESVHFSVNGGEFQQYAGMEALPTSSGSLSIKSIAKDKVENVSKENEEGSGMFIYADLSGPSLSMKYDGPTFETRDTIFISKATLINLFAHDEKSGVQKITYGINNGDKGEYQDPFNVEKEGFYHVDFVGHDNVNNTNESKFYFYVDNTGPDAFTRFSIEPIGKKEVDGKTVNIYPEHTVLFLSATDAHVGYDKIYYSLNGGTEKMYTGIIKNFKKGEVYTVTVKAFDTLGNFKVIEESFAIEEQLQSNTK